jgi:hypothetical protein
MPRPSSLGIAFFPREADEFLDVPTGRPAHLRCAASSRTSLIPTYTPRGVDHQTLTLGEFLPGTVEVHCEVGVSIRRCGEEIAARKRVTVLARINRLIE